MDVQVGHRHEALIYGSDDELVDAVAPFVTEGVDRGIPTLVSVRSHAASVVRDAFGDLDGLVHLNGEEQYSRPATTIRQIRALLQQHVDEGATEIRVLGEAPHPAHGQPWYWWARYESAVNRLFADFPLWGLCSYDARLTSEQVLDHVERTHPIVTRHTVPSASERYEEPHRFLRTLEPDDADPMEQAVPDLALVDPTVADARDVARGVAATTALSASNAEDLVIAVSEVVTNAELHGVPPVEVRMWASQDRVVVRVSDRGPGPDDPFVGLVPCEHNEIGGLGLWMAHQLCNDVTLHRSGPGFAVRLVAGRPLLEVA